MPRYTVEYEIKIQCQRDIEADNEDRAESQIYQEFEHNGDQMIMDELRYGAYSELAMDGATLIEEDEDEEIEEDNGEA